MELFSPKATTEAVEAAAEPKGFAASQPVEAGEYSMTIKTAPKVIISKTGNPYLQLMLTHTGEAAKGTTAVFPNFNLNEVGDSQFRQMLLSLGLSVDETASAQWGAASDETDEKGRRQGVIAINGEPISIEGRTLNVYLTKKDSEYNGQTRTKNEVARFIIS